MAELKTRKTDNNVADFINKVEDETKRNDSKVLVEMMQRATESKPAMWGDAIIGFGTRPYTYLDGRQMDWFICGFSPRKTNLALYLKGGIDGNIELIEQLGKYATGKSCLYIKKLKDVDMEVLEKLIATSVARP